MTYLYSKYAEGGAGSLTDGYSTSPSVVSQRKTNRRVCPALLNSKVFSNSISVKMSRSETRVASPGGPPEADDNDDDESEQLDEQMEESPAEQRSKNGPPKGAEVSEAPKAKGGKPQYLLFYQKKYFKVPAEAVVFSKNCPYIVESGLQANEIHDCKSFTKWSDQWEVHTRHMIKIKFEDETGVHCGLYVTFKIDGEESSDPLVIRALHKGIQQQYYESWTRAEKDGGWSESKRAKYAELIADKPGDESQINPLLARWKVTAAPGKVLYERPKKKAADANGGVAGVKKPAHKLKAAIAAAAADDDDDQSSAAQSTALTVRPQPSGGGPIAAGGGGFNFFANTPGMVTISEELYEKMAAVYYTQ